MLTTPYLNTYYFKTELKHNNIISKLKNKNQTYNFQKNQETNLSFGTVSLAVGIGLIGAFCAFKNKLLN